MTVWQNYKDLDYLYQIFSKYILKYTQKHQISLWQNLLDQYLLQIDGSL